MKRKLRKSYISEITIIALSLLIIVPLYMLVINSFKDKAGASEMSLGFPKSWQIIENYKEVYQIANIGTSYMNSIIISSFSVFLIILLSAMSGFIIQRRKQKIIEFLSFIILLGLIMPISIVPTYFLVKNLNLNSTFIGVCFVYCASMLPLGIFLYSGFYKSIPVSLDESAVLDGCSVYGLFFRIIFPLIKPVTATVLIASFMTVWNDLGISIYFLNNPKKYTVVLSTLSFYGQKAADWHLLFADIVLISLPIVILYFSLQKHIVSGLTGGAVKG